MPTLAAESKCGHAMRGEVRPGRREGAVGGDASGMHGEGPTQGWGCQGTRGMHTQNMSNMFATLKVSKLSGWLNLYARCRVEGRACDAGRGTAREACGRWVAARQSACTGRSRTHAGWGEQGRRGAHEDEHVDHVVTLDVSKL